MRKILVWCSILLLLESCVCALGVSPEHSLYVESKSGESDYTFQINRGTSWFKDDERIFELHIESVNQGANYALGLFKIREVVADDSLRIDVYKNQTLRARYSVNQILEMEFRYLGDSRKVYMLEAL